MFVHHALDVAEEADWIAAQAKRPVAKRKRRTVSPGPQTVHGTPGFASWADMIQRVSNPTRPSARNYLDRGIDCDPRWRDFKTFLADMGEKPKGMSLDRIDNDKGYWPNNCRWATRAEQSRNTRRNVWVIYDGRRMILKDALVLIGHSYQAYRHLARKYGWSAQEIVDFWLSKREAT